MVMVVAAEVDVKVEEAGAGLSMVVPVASSVQPEPDSAKHQGPERHVGSSVRTPYGRLAKSPQHGLSGSLPGRAGYGFALSVKLRAAHLGGKPRALRASNRR